MTRSMILLLLAGLALAGCDVDERPKDTNCFNGILHAKTRGTPGAWVPIHLTMKDGKPIPCESTK